MKNKLIFFSFLILFSNCLTEVGNPKQEGSKAALAVNGTKPGSLNLLSQNKLNAKFTSKFEELKSIDVINLDGTTVGSIQIEFAKIALKEIRIKSSCVEEENVLLNNSEKSNNFEFKENFIANLLNNTMDPLNIKKIEVPKGKSICDLEFKLFNISSQDYSNFDSIENENLIGNNLIIEGSYSGLIASTKVSNIKFFLSSNTEMLISLNNNENNKTIFSIEEGINNIILAFRMNKWFIFNESSTDYSYDFSNLQLENNEIILDENSISGNMKIRNNLINNIIISADFGKDANKNNILDLDEDDDPDTEDLLDN